MDLIGKIRKFPVNRHLTEEETLYSFKQDYSRDTEESRQRLPRHDYLTTIKMNSTYLEVVDRCYLFRGVGFAIGAVAFVMSFLLLLLALDAVTFRWHHVVEAQQERSTIILFIALLCLVLPLLVVSGYVVKRELFSLTHNPIRLNRKNRMVYAILYNNEVVAVPWDDIFFSQGKAGTGLYDLRGHILAEDGRTVKSTIGFGIINSSTWFLTRYFRFLRAYMDREPELIKPVINYCLPIADAKEGSAFSMRMLMAPFGGLAFILLPILVFFFLGRRITMAACKIPVWPDWVEAECRVDPDDPNIRDASQDTPVDYLTDLDPQGPVDDDDD